MTQNEMIEMAKQAGLHVSTDVNWMPIIGLAYVENLINLSVAKERAECIAIAESKRHAPNFKLASLPPQNGTAVDIANLIRARGQA
jgi:hypothetical protein